MPSHRFRLQKQHDPYAALRHRDFRLYTISNFLLTCANQIVPMTVGWELYGKTSQPLDLGLAGLSNALPFLLLGLFAGNVADRFDRRKVVVISTLFYTLGLVGLAFASAHRENLPHFNYIVFALLFFMGSFNAFYVPAKQALFRHLVPPQALPNAVTWGSAAFQTATILGPAIGGFLITYLPYFYVYAGTIFFELLFILVLSTLELRPSNVKKAPLSLKSLSEGAGFVWNTKPILATITMDLFAVLLGGCTALLPIFVKDILRSDPVTLGWLRAAPGAGAILMVVLLLYWPMKKPGVTLLWAVAGFGAATVVFGVSRNLWLSLAMMFLIGALDEISVILRGTLVQVLTPDRLLGRVQAVNYQFIFSSNELGAFESGATAQILKDALLRLGVATPEILSTALAVVLGGFGAIGIVLWVSWKWPQVAALKALHKHKVTE